MMVETGELNVRKENAMKNDKQPSAFLSNWIIALFARVCMHIAYGIKYMRLPWWKMEMFK